MYTVVPIPDYLSFKMECYTDRHYFIFLTGTCESQQGNYSKSCLEK